eukprot:15453717-Alexandrium_andersonii.AAC.1
MQAAPAAPASGGAASSTTALAPVGGGTTPPLPLQASGTAQGAPMAPPPLPPLVLPSTFAQVPDHMVPQYRANIVQQLIGDPALLHHIQQYGTISPFQAGVVLRGHVRAP